MKTRSGRVLTDTEVDRLADAAETGFDVSTWRPRRGRPPLAATTQEHSPRIAVRVPETLRQGVAERASGEGKTLSKVVRELLEGYAAQPRPMPKRKRPGRSGDARRS